MEQGLFAKCVSLKRVDIHEGVLSIGYGAFYYCPALEEIVLPSTLQSVEEQVFWGCSSLKKLTVCSETAPMCSRNIADNGVYARCVLYVPAGCVGEYGFARVWNKFENVEEIQ